MNFTASSSKKVQRKTPKETDPEIQKKLDLLKIARKNITKLQGLETMMLLKNSKLQSSPNAKYIGKQIYKDVDKVLVLLSDTQKWMMAKLTQWEHMSPALLEDKMGNEAEAKVSEVSNKVETTKKNLRNLGV